MEQLSKAELSITVPIHNYIMTSVFTNQDPPADILTMPRLKYIVQVQVLSMKICFLKEVFKMLRFGIKPFARSVNLLKCFTFTFTTAGR